MRATEGPLQWGLVIKEQMYACLLGARLNGKLLNHGTYVVLYQWLAFPWYSFRTLSLQYVGARSLSPCWMWAQMPPKSKRMSQRGPFPVEPRITSKIK